MINNECSLYYYDYTSVQLHLISSKHLAHPLPLPRNDKPYDQRKAIHSKGYWEARKKIETFESSAHVTRAIDPSARPFRCKQR